MALIECSTCKSRVLVKADGTCPSCGSHIEDGVPVPMARRPLPEQPQVQPEEEEESESSQIEQERHEQEMTNLKELSSSMRGMEAGRKQRDEIRRERLKVLFKELEDEPDENVKCPLCKSRPAITSLRTYSVMEWDEPGYSTLDLGDYVKQKIMCSYDLSTLRIHNHRTCWTCRTQPWRSGVIGGTLAFSIVIGLIAAGGYGFLTNEGVLNATWTKATILFVAAVAVFSLSGLFFSWAADPSEETLQPTDVTLSDKFLRSSGGKFRHEHVSDLADWLEEIDRKFIWAESLAHIKAGD